MYKNWQQKRSAANIPLCLGGQTKDRTLLKRPVKCNCYTIFEIICLYILRRLLGATLFMIYVNAI